MTKPEKTSLVIAALFVALAALLIGTGFLREIIFPQKPIIVTTGKALIGGPFSLIDHTGKRVSDKNYRGKYLLVFFGYTFCPDVCPAELQIISSALDKLGSKADKIQPLFITIDPERDTVKHLAQYVGHFHKSLIGLTGTPAETKAVAKQYRVYFAKVKNDKSTTEYLMDHSSLVYVMSPKGEYVTHFTYGTSPEKIVERLNKLL